MPGPLAAIIPAITGALGAGGAAGAAGAGAGAAGAGAGAAAGGVGARGMMGNLAKQFGPQMLMGGGGGGGDQQGGGGGGIPNPLDAATGMANNTLDTIANVANQGFNAMLDRNV